MTISILMNILNGAETLGDALDSVVDLADEVVAVIDDRTTDNTADILIDFAQKHPNIPVKIFHYRWADSFGEARNFALERCSCDWIWQHDHDEILDQKSIPVIKEVVEKHSVNAVIITILNDKKNGTAWHPACRLFRNGCATYVRRKHNVPVIEPNVTAFFPQIVLYHSGYDLTEEGLMEKFRRDEHLILRELEDNPQSVFAYRSLTRAYRSVKMHEKVIETAEKLFEMAKRENIDVSHSTRQMVAIDLIGTYRDMDNFDSAEEVAVKLIEEYPRNIDGHFLLATIYCTSGKHPEAIAEYERYLQLLSQHKQQPTNDQIVIESWGSEDMALHNMAYMNSVAGKHKKAARILQDAVNLKPNALSLREAFQYELGKIATGAPLNILFVQNITSSRNRKLARALRSKGHRVSLAYTQVNRFADESVYDEVFEVNTEPELMELVKNYDIIHCMETRGYFSLRLKEFTNALIIRDVHDISELYDQAPFISTISGISARHADGLTFSTPQQLYTMYSLYGIRVDDSMYIMNYASRSEEPEQKRPKLSDADGELHIVYEGYIGPHSHIDMKEIFWQIAQKRIHIHIYPAVECEEYYWLADMSEYIHYHGNLSFHQLIEEMTQYDAGIVPWNLEKGSKTYLASTIANKVFDYVLACLPVITCNSDALAAYVTQKEIGIVYDTVEDIANGVEILKAIDVSGKAEFMEDHIDELIGFYRVMLWQKHQPYQPGISLESTDIIALEESELDYINEAYFEHEGRNKQTTDRIDRIVELADGRVLDIGCSDGLLPILCARKGLTATGVDISPVHIMNALDNRDKETEEVKEKLDFIRSDAQDMDLNGGKFDTIIMGQVLEHVVDPDTVIEKAIDALNESGKLIATAPNGFLYSKKHLRHFSELSFRSLLERHCSVISIEHIGPRMLAICERDNPGEEIRSE